MKDENLKRKGEIVTTLEVEKDNVGVGKVAEGLEAQAPKGAELGS